MTRPALLPAWLRRDAEPVATPMRGMADVRASFLRTQYEMVGEFLDRQGLEPTDLNYAVARAHIAGEPLVTREVTALLRAGEPLTDAKMARIAELRERGLRPEMLAQMAEGLAQQLADCLRVVTATSQSNDRYRAALDNEVAEIAADPLGAVDRLVALTRHAVEVAATMEAELGVARQETERLRSNLRRAQRDADRDHLTGLPNRRHFEMRLSALARGRRACIALCDIDDFKVVNDSHGHGTGDRVLKFVGRLLRSELGEHALVARYGGEEFVCLFEDCDVETAAAHIDRTRAGLLSRSLARRDDGRAIGRVTFSAGVAPVAGDPREALRLADATLYDAKRGGKNQVLVARD
jgi:diguanylate cyclase